MKRDGSKAVKGMSEPITIESLINQHTNNQLDTKLPEVVSEQSKQIAQPPVRLNSFSSKYLVSGAGRMSGRRKPDPLNG